MTSPSVGPRIHSSQDTSGNELLRNPIQTKFTDTLMKHVMAEHMRTVRSEFFTALKEGRISDKQYHQYLVDQFAINNMLEFQTKNSIEKDVRFANLKFVGIGRSPYLIEDLKSDTFESMRTEPTNVAIKYCKYLKDLAPLYFFGHFYAKYLGDLSAGNIFKGQVEGKWSDRFYDFSDLLIEYGYPDAYAFKNEKFKESFNAIALSEHEKGEFISEVKKSFEYLYDVVAADSGEQPVVVAGESDFNLNFHHLRV